MLVFVQVIGLMLNRVQPMVLASNAIWHISLKMHFACMHGTDFGQKCNAFLRIIALTMHFWGKINLNFDFYYALFWVCRKFSYHACILHAKFPLPCILHVCNAFNARTMLKNRVLRLWINEKLCFHGERKLFQAIYSVTDHLWRLFQKPGFLAFFYKTHQNWFKTPPPIRFR